MKNSFILSVFNPKTLKKSRGGYSQNLLAQFLRYIKRSQVSDIASVCSETDIPLRVYKSHANNAVTTRLSRANHALCYADYQGVSYGSKGKRFDFQRCMRYAAMLLLCFVVGVGNVWGVDCNQYIASSGACGYDGSTYKILCPFGGTNIVEIQNPWGGGCGIYVIFSGEVSYCSLGSGNYASSGGGLLMYMDNFEAEETEVTVIAGGVNYTFTVYHEGGTSGGGGSSARTYDGEEKMYFLRDAWDWWKNDGAKFYAYFWNSSTGDEAWSEAASWAVQTTSESKDVWAYTVPAGTWDKVIITRHPSGTTTPTFDNASNKSNDITLEATTNLLTNWTVSGQTGHSITWSNITLGSKTVYFDNRNVTDWTTAYVRIGHNTSNSAWGTMTKVAGTRNLYSQATSQWDYHTDFTIANASGWTDNNIYQPWENQWTGTGNTYQMSKQTNYQKYGIDRDAYLCPASTSVLERDCQYYKVNSSTSTNTIDSNNQRMALPQYTVTATGTNCSVELVEYTADDFSTSRAITDNKVDPTRYVGVTVTPATGYEFGSVSLTSSAYEQHTAAAAGVTGKYAIMADCEISATCTPITYNITYKDQGNVAFSGSHADGYPETHTYGTATTLKTASKTGYTFGGWFANSTCTGSAVTSLGATAYTDDITLYAKWTVKTYSITLDKNHSGTGDNGSATVTYGSTSLSNLIAPSARTGYTIRAYYVSPESGSAYAANSSGTLQKSITDLTNESREWIYDGDVTLYTKWNGIQYDVTLNHENGDADATVLATFGSNMPTKYKGTQTTLVVPVRSGYTLGGYYDEIGGGGTRYYRLNNNKDQLVSAQGWDKASTATLYAKWTQSITLDREIGTSGSTGVTATYNSATLGSFKNPTKTGYTFAGYYDGDDGTGNLVINTAQELQPNVTDYTDESGRWIHEGATTLYAKWTANQYNVTLDHENGTPTSLVQATYGADMPSTLNDGETPVTKPTKSGYSFFGYYSGVGGSGSKYYKDNLESNRVWNVANDATLYAWWRQFINLDGEGGSSGSGKVIATYHSATLGSFYNPTKTGYTFGGYYDGDDGTGNLVINTDQELQASVTGCTDSDGKWIHDGASVTLHAKWTANTYDIAYKDGGDTEFSGTHEDGYPTTHTYGTATTLKSATKTGYTFGGWYTSPACTGAAVTSLGATAYTDDITLYAKWTIKTYTITLEDGGAATAVSPTSVTATYNSSSLSSAITAPVQSGYTFGGWWTGESGKSGVEVIDSDGYLQASVAGYTDASSQWIYDGDVTLYAKWDVEGGGGGSQYCDYVMTATDEVTTATFSFTHPSTNTYIVTIHSDNANFTGLIGAGNYCHVNDAGTNLQIQQSSDFVEWNGSTKTLTITLTSTGGYSPYFYTPFYLNFSGEKTFNTLQNQSFIWPESCGATTYTVTYDANGADDGTVPVDAFSPYAEGATVTVLGNPHDLTKAGSTFNGWNTAEDGNGIHYAAGSTFTITDDVTLYAKWVSASGTTITLDANTANHGEAGNQSVTAVKGSALPDFTHTTAATGYQIEGYYTTASGEGTKIIHANKTLVANTAYTDGAGNWNSNEETLTLYARYEPCTYTISYYDQGGSAFSGSHEVGYPTTHTYGTATTLKGATKAGYNFDGWFTTTTCTGDPVTSLGATVYTANINLYAKWTDPTLCSQDGGAESGQTLDTEPKIKKFKKGYTFSVKQGVDANHIVVNTRIIDDDFASIGQVYLLFHSNATTLDEYAYISLGSGTSVISNAVIDLSTLALKDDATRFMNADPILCMSVKYEVDGDGEVRITDRMYFDRENGGCTEPEEGETEAYFDIYHHDDAPEGARTSYEGGNIVVPIRYFRHFEHTGWCAISLPFKVSKVAVYDEDEKQEYDLYPRFTNNSGNVEGYYWLKTFSGNVSLSGFKPAWQQLTYPTNLTGATADEETTLAKNVKPAENTPYVIAFPDGTYYRKNWVIFYGEAFQTIDADFTGESSITLTDGYDYNQVQLQANNTMHASGTLNNIYMIEEGFDYFTRRESATVPAFEAYVIGTAEVQTRYSILRYTGEEENIPDVTDQPTGIENTPPTTAGYDGEVYTVAGIRVAGFANRDEMETLLNNLGAGVYVVRMGTQINKVVVY